MRATFVGRDRSLGYRTGCTYDLITSSSDKYPIIVRRSNGRGYCPYSSEAAFRRNWRVMEALDPKERNDAADQS
jgi:hypothetical protein